MQLWANLFYEMAGDRVVLRAMPLMIGVLCCLAIAYRYYSAFLAARVAALDDSRVTPAHRFNDGQNYHPTNKWVLFGHHFAAISGAGPLIGPVLAIQYGYMPGLVWLVIGVCLAGAVQDMLVLAASVRHDGKSLAQIALVELGRSASLVVSAAILFIVIIALAGLGFVVVKAIGGEEVKLTPAKRITGHEITPPPEVKIVLPQGESLVPLGEHRYRFPAGCTLLFGNGPKMNRPEEFVIATRPYMAEDRMADGLTAIKMFDAEELTADSSGVVVLPPNTVQVVPGSSWGTFTIACTIPIALFVGLYMYRLRPGKIVEASLIGAVLVLAATVGGNWVPGSPLAGWFTLSRTETILALTGYGFVAAVLPVWLLLGPRDYLSSFLKIGTVAMLVVGVIVANPTLPCPPINETFLHGGPTFEGSLFPFVFICIMCGAISGFHSLVSSGTTPKMVERESQVRPIGYGAMLIEGLVGVVALIAAASLPPDLYYDINVDFDAAPRFQGKLDELYLNLGVGREAGDRLHAVNVDSVAHLRDPDLAQMEEMVGGESLRGRTGGAVTLAVGMALIFQKALAWTGLAGGTLLKYWYHFAIMFEALFILTTIDAGTRIARFMLQETLGKVYRPFERPDWIPGAVFASLGVTVAWGALVYSGSIRTIWPMFGIANQLLAVLALTLVTTWLVNTGRGRYAFVTVPPILFVSTTTLTAGTQMVNVQFPKLIADGAIWTGRLNIGLTLFVMVSVGTLVLMAVSRWVAVLTGMVPPRKSA